MTAPNLFLSLTANRCEDGKYSRQVLATGHVTGVAIIKTYPLLLSARSTRSSIAGPKWQAPSDVWRVGDLVWVCFLHSYLNIILSVVLLAWCIDSLLSSVNRVLCFFFMPDSFPSSRHTICSSTQFRHQLFACVSELQHHLITSLVQFL